MFIKTRQVCDILNVAPNTVKSLVLKGELPAIRVGGNYRYRQEDIDDYIERQRIEPTTDAYHRCNADEMLSSLKPISDEMLADAKERTDKLLAELEQRQAEQAQ